jgi:hypothetical protein
MTLAEIKQAGPSFRDTLQRAVEDKNIQVILEAIRKDITAKIGKAPAPHPSQTFDGAVSNWHSHLAGMQAVLHILDTIGQDTPKATPLMDAAQEAPYEHAIDPRLVKAMKEQMSKAAGQ